MIKNEIRLFPCIRWIKMHTRRQDIIDGIEGKYIPTNEDIDVSYAFFVYSVFKKEGCFVEIKKRKKGEIGKYIRIAKFYLSQLDIKQARECLNDKILDYQTGILALPNLSVFTKYLLNNMKNQDLEV